MKYKVTLITSLIFISAFLTSCGSGEPANSANSNAVIVNTTNTNTNAVAVSTPTPDAVTNNAPTLTPVYKAYCAAMVKKDEAAVRKLYSADTIAFFESEMKADGIKTLTEYLSTDQVSNELCEVTNERITGERAIGKIKSKGYPNGMDVVFVKEGGEWKLTVDDVNKK
ncbi:MAG: nuclear transport factor 2 family protein [Pyrinomonadaceae bacterium]